MNKKRNLELNSLKRKDYIQSKFTRTSETQHTAFKPSYQRPRTAFRKLYVEQDRSGDFSESALDFYASTSTHKLQNSYDRELISPSPLGGTCQRTEGSFDTTYTRSPNLKLEKSINLRPASSSNYTKYISKTITIRRPIRDNHRLGGIHGKQMSIPQSQSTSPNITSEMPVQTTDGSESPGLDVFTRRKEGGVKRRPLSLRPFRLQSQMLTPNQENKKVSRVRIPQPIVTSPVNTSTNTVQFYVDDELNLRNSGQQSPHDNDSMHYTYSPNLRGRNLIYSKQKFYDQFYSTKQKLKQSDFGIKGKKIPKNKTKVEDLLSRVHNKW